MSVIDLSAGKVTTLNVMKSGSTNFLIDLISRMANVQLSPDEKAAGIAIIDNLPKGSMIYNFINACNSDAAKRLGMSADTFKALKPLFDALHKANEPGQYSGLFSTDL